MLFWGMVLFELLYMEKSSILKYGKALNILIVPHPPSPDMILCVHVMCSITGTQILVGLLFFQQSAQHQPSQTLLSFQNPMRLGMSWGKVKYTLKGTLNYNVHFLLTCRNEQNESFITTLLPFECPHPPLLLWATFSQNKGTLICVLF